MSSPPGLRRPRRAPVGGSPLAERVSGPFREWRAPFGAMSAANWIAMNATQYMHRYGAPREMLGIIAVNGRTECRRGIPMPSTGIP